MGDGWESGAAWGLASGAFLGACTVYRWGFCGLRPAWAKGPAAATAIVAGLLIAAGRLLGVPPDFWWAFAVCLPLSFLPFLSLAYSAHSYTIQSFLLAGHSLYLAGVLALLGLLQSAATPCLLAVTFLLLPGFFAWRGQLDDVQRCNDFAWTWVRKRLTFRRAD